LAQDNGETGASVLGADAIVWPQAEFGQTTRSKLLQVTRRNESAGTIEIRVKHVATEFELHRFIAESAS
jgi:hypothetical protein